ncbi:3213_t:CDS:1, partial [Racocetra persica]
MTQRLTRLKKGDVNEKTVNAISGNEIRPAHEETKKKQSLYLFRR